MSLNTSTLSVNSSCFFEVHEVKKIKNATIEHKRIGFILKKSFLFKRRKKNVKLISDYNFMKDNYNIMKIKIVSKGEQLVYT